MTLPALRVSGVEPAQAWLEDFRRGNKRGRESFFRSWGQVTANPNPACIGDAITFTASGVVDSGGEKRVDCVVNEEVPPVTPTYTWELTIPPDYPAPLPPLSGSGPTASVMGKVPGTYSCTFTATADRDCPPGPRIVIGAAATLPVR